MKTKKTTKKVKITNYKKAYESILRLHEALKKERNELQKKYTKLAKALEKERLEKQALVRRCNQLAPSISALLISEQLKYKSMQELATIRDEIIKHDV